MEKAIFAAGYFWGVEEAFDGLKGVLSSKVGYTGGTKPNPTYKKFAQEAEVIEILFDSKVISYEELLNIFWKIHDPTTINRQGPDVGTQYRSSIFIHSLEQEQIARASLEKIAPKFDNPIVTQIIPATTFYEAEKYHQKYFKKSQ